MAKTLIALTAENCCGGRSWMLRLHNDGYTIAVQEWGAWGDMDEEFFIPTHKALQYLQQAKEGSLPLSFLCFGVEDYNRGTDGTYRGYTYCN